MTVQITRLNMNAAALRKEASGHSDANAARRILAIAMILEGAKRKTAAERCGMDRQTLRDWVHRYDAEGIEGLSNRKAPGRPPYLTDAQKDELADLVRQGPDPKQHGVVRWRRRRNNRQNQAINSDLMKSCRF